MKRKKKLVSIYVIIYLLVGGKRCTVPPFLVSIFFVCGSSNGFIFISLLYNCVYIYLSKAEISIIY